MGSESLIRNLVDASDLLTAGSVLKEIDALLSSQAVDRRVFCRNLSAALNDRVRPLASWLLLDPKPYAIYPPSVSTPAYLWMHGLASGKVREVRPRLKELVAHIESCFTSRSGNCITAERVERVLRTVHKKLPYFQIVCGREPLRILLFDDTHVDHNSQFIADVDSGRFFALIYHMKDHQTDPEYVLLHELGHGLQVAVTGTLDAVPEEFIQFHMAYGGQIEDIELHGPELFADLFAIAAMRGTDLSLHDPFPFPDKFKDDVEHCIEAILRNHCGTS